MTQRGRKLALSALAVLACMGLGPRSTSGYDWSGFHGGASFSRESVEIVGTPVSQAWQTQLDGPILASPIIHNGRIYVGTRTGHFYCVDASSGAVVWNSVLASRIDATAALVHGRVYLSTSDGDLLALNAATGSVIWRQQFGCTNMSSPLVTNGMVVIGVGSPSPDVRAYSESSGQELWRYATAQALYSSPTFYRGLIYCATSTGTYFCLDLNGKPVWSATTQGGVMLSSPELRYGRCFGFPGHFDPNLYAWDASAGTLLWSGNPAAPPTATSSTPTLDEDFLQEVLAQDPSQRQAFIQAWAGVSQQDLLLYQQAVAHADRYTDNEELPPAQAPFITSSHVKPSSPAVGADHLVFVQKGLGFPNPRFSVVCMKATTGAPQWWYQEVAPTETIGCASSPAISLDRVFVGLSSRLYTFDLSSGQLLDTRQLDGDVYCSPAIGNGLVVAGTFNGSLYAFQTANHAPSAPQPPISPVEGEDVHTSTPTLSWSASVDPDPSDGAGVLRYLVEVDTDGELDWNYQNQYATLPGQTTVILPATPDNTRVVWKVRAVDPDGAVSPWSPMHSFTVNKAQEPVQLKDALFLNAIPGDSQVFLVWGDPPGQVFDGYRLTVRDEFGRERSPITLGRVESTTVTGLSNFVRYTFRLVAYRLQGGQSPGIEASATPRPLISVGNRAFATVEDAIDAAKPGDTVRLGMGTIPADHVRLSRGISLVGVGPGYTILKGVSADKPVIRISPNTRQQPPLVAMMTVTNGSDGILVEEHGRASIQHLILMGLENGVHLHQDATAEIINNTISDNHGHGIWIHGRGDGHDDAVDDQERSDREDQKKDDADEKTRPVTTLRNNIITYNGGVGIKGPHRDDVPITSTFSDLFANAQGNYDGLVTGGQGGIALEPLFVAKAPSDYRLKPDSPCVDAGDPTDAFDQEPEPNGGRIDMGAYGDTPFAGAGKGKGAAAVAGQGCFLSAARGRR